MSIREILHQIHLHWDEIDEEISNFGIEVTLDRVYLLRGGQRALEAKMSSNDVDARLVIEEIVEQEV